MLPRPGSRQRRVGPYQYTHTVFGTETVFDHHHHRRGHLVMVYSGSWRDTAGGRELELEAGELLYHPVHYEHATRSTSPWTELIMLHLGVEVVRAFCPLYGNVTRDVHLPFEALRGVPDRIREELLRSDPATPVILESLTTQLLALGSRTPEEGGVLPPVWFSKVLTIINRTYNRPLTVSAIAAEVGISASRLAHVFRDVTSRSISEYIRECRVRAAAKALRETSASIGDVALSCGFYDQAHLTRAFKAVRGDTPLNYRRSQHRAPAPERKSAV